MSRLYDALTALERKRTGVPTAPVSPVGAEPGARQRWPAITLIVLAFSAAAALMVMPRDRSTALQPPAPAIGDARHRPGVHVPNLREQGRDAAMLGLVEEAEALLQQAIKLTPADAVAWNDLGVVLVRRAELQRAIEAFRLSVSIDPKYAAAHRNLAVTLEQNGKLTEAMSHYRAFLTLSPDDPDRGLIAARLARAR